MKISRFNLTCSTRLFWGMVAVFVSVTLLSLGGCAREDRMAPEEIRSTVDGMTFSISAQGIGVAAPSTKGTENQSSCEDYDESYEIASVLLPSASAEKGSVSEIFSNLKYGGSESYYNVSIGGLNYKYESIFWEKGDKISIGMYAPPLKVNDGSVPSSDLFADFVDYQIDAVSGEPQEPSRATITGIFNKGIRWKPAGTGGTSVASPYDRLLWNNAPYGAVFFAFWPDMASNTRTPAQLSFYNTIKGGEHELRSHFTIPDEQYCTLKEGSATDKIIYSPDMNIAHMSATDIAYQKGNDVKLRFYPDFTAFEFIIKNDSPSIQMRLKEVRLESLNNYISGLFTSIHKIRNTGAENTKGFNFSIKAGDGISTAVDETTGKKISMKFKKGDAIQDYVNLSDTPLQFTIIASSEASQMVGTTAKGIAVRSSSVISGCAIFFDMQISTDGGSTWKDVTRQLDLRSNPTGETNASDWIKIPARCKVVVSNVAVPEQVGSFTAKPFSVSATKKVVFSPGNLQAKPNGYGSVSEWRFAPRQWEIIGKYDASSDAQNLNPNGFDYDSTTGENGFSAENTHWMDFFTLSTSGGIPQVSWGVVNPADPAMDDTQYGLTFLDFGNNPDIINTLGSGWFTLSKAEWLYLLQERDNNAQKWTLASVGNVGGLVLLPDDWTLPINCRFVPQKTDFTSITYSNGRVVGNSGSWNEMEKAGAVFLPAAGSLVRTGRLRFTSPEYMTSTFSVYNGKFYSAPFVSCTYSYNGGYILDAPPHVSNSTGIRNIGLSVRLVKDAAALGMVGFNAVSGGSSDSPTSLSSGAASSSYSDTYAADADKTYQIYYDFISGRNIEKPSGGNSSNDHSVSSDTRYSGEIITITSSDKRERIDWIKDDRLTIHEFYSGNTEEYVIDSVNDIDNSSPNSESKSVGKLRSVNPNGLQWLKGQDNLFMAIYPSLTDMGVDYHNWNLHNQNTNTREAGFAADYTVIPANQVCWYNSSRTSQRWYEADMRYAYMIAAANVPEASVPKSALNLEFTPNFNSVEIRLVKPASLASHKVKIVKAELTTGSGTGSTITPLNSYLESPENMTTYFTWRRTTGVSSIVRRGTTSSSTGNKIALTFRDKAISSTTDITPELDTDIPLSFTFLTLPVNIRQLELRLYLTIDDVPVDRALNLKTGGNWIPLGTGKKLTITNMATWGFEYVLNQPNSISPIAYDATTGSTTIQSYKSAGGSLVSPIDVQFSYSLDGTAFYSYDDTSMPAKLRGMLASDINAANINNKEYSAELNLVASNRDLGNESLQILRNREDIMSLPGASTNALGNSDYANLACYEPMSETFHAAPQTANAYIIRRPGKYALPLVYGNGLDYKKNSVAPHFNTVAYAPEGTNSKTFLTPFLNVAGEGIISPWLHQDLFGNNISALLGSCEAVIVWQDVPSTEQFLNFATSDPNLSNAPFATYSQQSWGIGEAPYLHFEIDENKICQGNVVIAVRKKAEADPAQPILWSWHIWVTSEDLKAVAITKKSGEITNLLSVPLGFCREQTPEREFFVKVAQKEGPGTGKAAPKIFRVYQERNDIVNAPFYYGGRKDPFLPGDGIQRQETNGNKAWSSPAGYEISGDTGVTEAAAGTTTSIKMAKESSDYSIPYSIEFPYIRRRGYSTRTHYNLWDATRTYADTKVTPTDVDRIPVKTIYDPSPAGFCVPRRDFFDWQVSNIISDKGNAGWDCGWWVKCSPTDQKEYFYHAMGHRHKDDGTVRKMDSSGNWLGSYQLSVPFETGNLGFRVMALFYNSMGLSFFQLDYGVPLIPAQEN